MSVTLLTDHHLEFLSLKGGCTGSSESTLVKMPHCWKSGVTAHMFLFLVSFFRTNTVILVDFDGNCDYYERTLDTPVNSDNLTFSSLSYSFKLDSGLQI